MSGLAINALNFLFGMAIGGFTVSCFFCIVESSRHKPREQPSDGCPCDDRKTAEATFKEALDALKVSSRIKI